ncbi:MAG TPA: stage V sporulation protein AD, partial [Symbiobacteriaceae bacterium]|nr:stage V sporulation protein AD [Symbiobacteriaceae bacterium]
DLIVTGDLARFGRDLAVTLAGERGLRLGDNYRDCGVLVYDNEKQDVHSGGSGCGCSAIVTCGHLLKEMRRGTLRRLLLVATGALLSPTTFQQGENIPTIAHAVAIEV